MIIDTTKNEIIIYNFDCNRSKSNVGMDKLYYKFFNEWKNKTHTVIFDVTYKIHKDSFNGIVTLRKIKGY